MPVEPIAVAAQVAPGVLVEIEGVEGAGKAGLKIFQQSNDPAELLQVLGMCYSGDDDLVSAATVGDRAEAGQPIGEHLAAWRQVLSGPGNNRLGTEASNRRDLGVNWPACPIQRNHRHDRNLYSPISDRLCRQCVLHRGRHHASGSFPAARDRTPPRARSELVKQVKHCY